MQTDNNDFWFFNDNPISRVGVFPYLGRQISREYEPDKTYKVYRPAEELFSPETVKSFKLVPLIEDHEMLGADFTPPEQKGVDGVVGENVYGKDNVLFGNIKVFSERLKKRLKNGKKEISLGYYCTYDLTPGEYQGEHYDAVQRNIDGNHCAIVHNGRMGHDVRIMLDSKDKVFMVEKIVLDESNFNALHPRDKDGEFTDKGSGTSGPAKTTENIFVEKAEIKQKANEHFKKGKLLCKLDGKEFKGTTLKEKWEDAFNYFNKNLRNTKYINSSCGKEITIVNIKKALHDAFYEDKVNVIKHLPEILKESVYIGSCRDTKGRPNVKAFYYLAGNVETSEGKRTCVLSIKEDDKGNLYYNHTFSGKSEMEDCWCPAPKARASQSSIDDSIADKNDFVNHTFSEKKGTEDSRGKAFVGQVFQSSVGDSIADKNETVNILYLGDEEFSGEVKSLNPQKKENIGMEKSEKMRQITEVANKPVSEFKGGEAEQMEVIHKMTEMEKPVKDADVKPEDNKPKDVEPAVPVEQSKDDKIKSLEAQIAGLLEKIKNMPKEMKRTEDLKDQLKGVIGSFDSADMVTEQEVAEYGCKKLNIMPDNKKEALSTINGYLRAKKEERKNFVVLDSAIETGNNKIEAIEAFLKGESK